MEGGQLTLLVQLITTLKDNYTRLETAFKSSDKENFDKYKKVILEVQAKINYLLNQQ